MQRQLHGPCVNVNYMNDTDTRLQMMTVKHITTILSTKRRDLKFFQEELLKIIAVTILEQIADTL